MLQKTRAFWARIPFFPSLFVFSYLRSYVRIAMTLFEILAQKGVIPREDVSVLTERAASLGGDVETALIDHGVLKCSLDAAIEKRHTSVFFPHGVGHHLGIQVHDIGGHQKARAGGVRPPPLGHPYLRNTRIMEAGHVFTIEPGIYLRPSKEIAKEYWNIVIINRINLGLVIISDCLKSLSGN